MVFLSILSVGWGRGREDVQQLQGQAAAPGQGNHTNNSPAHSEVIAQARTIIREVRFSLHQFRDDRWEKLVRVRNHLMRITILTGLAIYLLVAFVIIILPPHSLFSHYPFFLT